MPSLYEARTLKTWPEEPGGEDEPSDSAEGPLEQPTGALDRGCKEEGNECGSSPSPGPLEKDDVEETAFGCQGVCCG